MPRRGNENRLDSAIAPAAGRMAARLSTLSNIRPLKPLSFAVDSFNFFSWDPPPRDNFTHYRLRIDHDDGDPDYEFPAGQRGIQLFVGHNFFLSAYNDQSRLESAQLRVTHDCEAAVFGGGAGGSNYNDTHTVSGSSYTFTTARTATSSDWLVLFIEFTSTSASITLTWDTVFKNPPAVLNTDQNTLSTITFKGRGSNWYCTSWLTGQPTV